MPPPIAPEGLVLARVPLEEARDREELLPDRLPETLKRAASVADLNSFLDSAQLLRREESAPRSDKAGAPPKKKPRAKSKHLFSIILQGGGEIFKVLPTSKGQRNRLLALLQDEGGVVI